MVNHTDMPLVEKKERAATSIQFDAGNSANSVDMSTASIGPVTELVDPAVFDNTNKLLIIQLSLVLCDACIIALCVLFGSIASTQLRELFNLPPFIDSALAATAAVVYFLPIVVVVVLSALRGHYTKYRPFWAETYEIINTLLLMGAIFFFALFLFNEHMSRLWLLISWTSMIFLIPFGRYKVKKMLEGIDVWYRPLVVVETEPGSDRIAQTLSQHMHMGYKVVATVSLREALQTANKKGHSADLAASPLNVIVDTLNKYRKSHLLLILNQSDDFLNHRRLINKLSLVTQNLIVVPPLSDLPLLGTTIIGVPKKNELFLHIRLGLNRPELKIVKRVFDVVFSALSMLILSPLLLFLTVYIFLKDGSPFYAHRRIGQNGKSFDCWKFRTMKQDSNDLLEALLETDSVAMFEWSETRKLKNDPRITSIGKTLRQTSLDELPQLWNVLRGDMSMVGPRPIVEDEVRHYGDRFEYYKAILPGITGLWQVSGRNDIEYSERVNLDVWYVRNWSIWTDIVIILSTIPVLFGKKGAY